MRIEIGICRRVDGYTVIEMLIALTLLVTAMIPLAVILSTGLKTTVHTSTRMHAREVAASEIDKVKSLRFDAIGISSAADTFVAADPGEQVKPETGFPGIIAGPVAIQAPNGEMFTVTRDVRKFVNTTNANAAFTKKVIVVVSWTSPEPAGSYELSTIIGSTEMID